MRSYKPGDYLVSCDRTGKVCYRSECLVEWDGQLVHWTEYEARHPMDTQRVRGERNNVKDARPDTVSLELNHEERIP